jgi:hypothetical protein
VLRRQSVEEIRLGKEEEEGGANEARERYEVLYSIVVYSRKNHAEQKGSWRFGRIFHFFPLNSRAPPEYLLVIAV